MRRSPSPGHANGSLATAAKVRSVCWIAPAARAGYARHAPPRGGIPRAEASHGHEPLPPIDPWPTVQHDEHAAPGDLLHLAIKKLGCIVRPGHRFTAVLATARRSRRECVHIAIDEHGRGWLFRRMTDASAVSAGAFLRAASPITPLSASRSSVFALQAEPTLDRPAERRALQAGAPASTPRRSSTGF